MAQGRAAIKHRVKLTDDERHELEQLVRRGAAGWKLKRAQALLKSDEGEAGPAWSDVQVAEALGVTTRSLENWRKQVAAATRRGELWSKGRCRCWHASRRTARGSVSLMVQAKRRW